MKSAKQLIFTACAVLAFAGQVMAAAPAPRAAPAAAPPPVLTQIGPGDQIRIEVFNSPDLATTATVTEDGMARMPLAGSISVGGQSPAEAARRIEFALKSGEFLVNPQVTVSILQSLSQRVSVLGEVATPGRYPIEANTTVFDLIATAGGISEKGSEVVYIYRPDAAGVVQRLSVDLRSLGGPQGANLAASEPVRRGDSIVVPKGTFFIIGEVSSPGEYRIEGEMILFEAIARAGGVTPLGSASRVEVQRRGPDDKVVEVKKVKKNLRIQPGDVIRVKERLF